MIYNNVYLSFASFRFTEHLDCSKSIFYSVNFRKEKINIFKLKTSCKKSVKSAKEILWLISMNPKIIMNQSFKGTVVNRALRVCHRERFLAPPPPINFVHEHF